MTIELNTEALTAPVRRRDIRQFYRGFSAQHDSLAKPFTRERRAGAIIGGIAGVIGILAIGFGISEELGADAADAATEVVSMVAIIAVLLLAAAIFAYYFFRTQLRRGTPRRHYRLAAFAAANGMTYLPGPYNGNHLIPWRNRGEFAVSQLLKRYSGRQLEVSNFELAKSTSSGGSRMFGGYCSVRLTTALPHILLRATGNPLSEWTMQSFPARPQRLSLEGDFDRYFTLYCPVGYERDALYLFTPDIMARLIDSVRGFDVEIIDDWLILTKGGDMVTLRPETWNSVATAISALTEKVERWERWREDRPVDASHTPALSQVSDSVASPGRRLRMTLSRGNLLWTLFGVLCLLAIILTSVFR